MPTAVKEKEEVIRVEGYTPTELQARYHNAIDEHLYTLFMGGYGSGKSRAAIEEDIDLSMRFPGNLGMITRKYNEDLRDTVKADFYKWCPPQLIAETRDGGNTVIFINGSAIIFKGLYTKSKSQRTKLGSLNLGFFDVHEADEISEQDFQDLQGRLRREDIPTKRGYLNCNPPNTNHWLYKTFVNSPDKNLYALIKGKTEENPHLDPVYVENLRKSYANSPILLQKYMDGEWGFTPAGTPAFTGYKDGFHHVPLEVIPGRPVYRCWDFGWLHPGVVFFQIDENRGVNILSCDMGDRINFELYCPYMIHVSNKKFPKGKFIDVCDIAGLQHKDTGKPSIKVLNDYGIKPFYHTQPREFGINLMQRMLITLVDTHPQLRVNSKDGECKLIHDALSGGYCRDEEGLVVDDFYYENVMDPLRYGIVHAFGARKSANANIEISQPDYSSSTGGADITSNRERVMRELGRKPIRVGGYA